MTEIQPQPGDFCVRPVPGVIGLGISVGQVLNGEKWGRHDHAEVYIGRADAEGVHGYIASAYPNRKGIRPLPVPATEMPGAVWSTGRIELTFEQRTGIVEWCLQHPAVGYSWLDYAALIAHRLGSNDPALRRYIASTRTMICSWYTDAAYAYGGDVHLFSGIWEGYVTPGMLAELTGS